MSPFFGEVMMICVPVGGSTAAPVRSSELFVDALTAVADTGGARALVGAVVTAEPPQLVNMPRLRRLTANLFITQETVRQSWGDPTDLPAGAAQSPSVTVP